MTDMVEGISLLMLNPSKKTQTTFAASETRQNSSSISNKGAPLCLASKGGHTH